MRLETINSIVTASLGGELLEIGCVADM